MKVQTATNHLIPKQKASQAEVMAAKSPQQDIEDRVEIRAKKIERMSVEKNSPDNPRVATKVLDSLSTGMVNFSQDQRDVLATILAERAEKVKQERS